MRRSGRSEAWYRVRFGSGRSLVRIQSPRPLVPIIRRLRDLFDVRWTVGDLVCFHTAHKLVLMAHSLPGYARRGRSAQRRRHPYRLFEGTGDLDRRRVGNDTHAHQARAN